MAEMTSTGADAAMGPDRKANEKHVHIIYVSAQLILDEMKVKAFRGVGADTVTLGHVQKHILNPGPTDIIVFNKEPYHYAGDPPGKPMELREHPQVHHDFPETIVVIRPNEQVVWWSDRAFEIIDAMPSTHGPHDPHRFPESLEPPPPYPFTVASPIPARPERHQRGEFWVARSGVPKVDAHQHMYKIKFKIENDEIDPDGYCSGGQ